MTEQQPAQRIHALLEHVAEAAARAHTTHQEEEAKFLLIVKKVGTWMLDTNGELTRETIPGELRRVQATATLTYASSEVFFRLAEKKLSGPSALMSGKLGFKGQMQRLPLLASWFAEALEKNKSKATPVLKGITLKPKSDWQNDDASRQCLLCRSTWNSVTNRRHHCRYCGSLVCGDCSKGRVEGVRACDFCLREAQSFAAQQRHQEGNLASKFARGLGRLEKHGSGSDEDASHMSIADADAMESLKERIAELELDVANMDKASFAFRAAILRHTVTSVLLVMVACACGFQVFVVHMLLGSRLITFLWVLGMALHYYVTEGLLPRRLRAFLTAAVMIGGLRLTRTYTKHCRPEESDAIWNFVQKLLAPFLYESIVQLKGLWVKAGQVLSSRVEVLPKVFIYHLSFLQDAVPPSPWKEVESTLQSELGGVHPRSVFESYDEKALASASVAQVHRATLSGGKKVVVKVQHRTAFALMMTDILDMRRILSFVAWMDGEFDFRPIMDEWLAAVKNELDFRHEGRNLVRMKQAMKESGLDVLIPDVVPEFTSKKVVVMSFCEGVKVTEPKLLTMDASIREAFMHTVCESFAYQMHIEGLFHGDAHPGNILVQVRGNGEGGAMHARPVLLDWGLTKELTTPMRLAFSKFVYSASEMDIVSMLESFEDLGVKLNRFNPAEDMQNIMFILRDTAAPEEARKQMKGFRRVAKARRAAGLKNPVDAYPGDLLFFMRATTMLRALCTLMHTKLPYMAIMAPYARRALMESVPQEERAIHFIYQSPVLSSLETRLRRKLEALNDEGLIGGCQVSVMRMGVRIVDTCVGVQGPVDPRPVTPRSLFCCFSVGKAIASLALHMLLDGKGLSNEAAQNGWLSEGVDTPVAKFWPEFGKHGKQHCTIRHILTHSCGLQHVFAGGLDDFVNWDKMLHLLEEATPLWPPGKRSSYHYFTYGWLVGGCVERLSGSKFSDFVKHFIAHPLGLVDHIFMGDLQARGIEDERLATVEHSMFKEVAASSMDEFERAARVDSADTPMEDGSDISDGDGRLQKDAMENGTFLDMMARAVAEDDPIEGSALEDLARSLRGKEFMLDPRLYNWKKMRNACIPSANGFFTASGLCTIFSDMLQSLDSGGVLLSRKAVDELRKFQVEEESALHRLFGLPNGVRYGLGFQLFGFREKYIDSSSESIRKRVRLSGFGHSGVNGSLVVADAATGVSIAITLNKIVSGRRATSEILSVVCKELQMGAPCSVFAGGM